MTFLRPVLGKREEMMIDLMKRTWREEEGATAVEYALMVALIAVVMIVAVRALGTAVSAKFNTVATELNNAGT